VVKPRPPDLNAFLKSTKTTSFIVIKDGQVRYEAYSNGYSRDSVVTSFSVAKSVMSALAGVAISEGYIGSVDDKVTLYLPELRGKGFDDVSIRTLLTMSSGIHFTGGDQAPLNEELTLTDDETLAYYYPDLRSRALGVKPDGLPAGAEFNYNNYLPQLLGIILERTTQRSVSEYLSQKIWQSLGAEFPASWSLDGKNGFEQMQSGINARAIDFAKFGQMFLNGGELNGRQVIPSAWVKESTEPDPNDHRPWQSDREWVEAGGYYKYFWWGMPNQDGTYDYVARGHLGQRIYVSQRNNTVVVRFGINEGGVDNWDAVIASIIASMR
jgi:CubicO group peptidase (beta-lactamase class C family)